MKSYKIKKRYAKHDRGIKTGYYIYSRTYQKYKNGRSYRRKRLGGSFETRSDAITQAGLLNLRREEFLKRR